ncbi:sphingomyelin phosphodiesterase 1-like [Hyposmocoma kahamanoa]|uniref:sphingomyelin phosphodiesterase 1-like n=1 Tax=Hyposmocoma kahamanoa TaxID=1477025 RepID=UPI000E6DA07E|nr:sphingomyelin phosphodiesterase 1-like [Hyposmocoma kahamanoa]
MKVLFIVFMLFSSSLAKRLITTGELEQLFRKALAEELTDDDQILLQEVIDIVYRPEHISGRSLEFSSSTRSTLDCIICRSALSAFFIQVHNGQSDQSLTTVVSSFCVNLGIENERVCKGAVGLNIPIFTYIIKNEPAATPATFCSLQLQNANGDVCPSNDPRFEWTVELPEPSNEVTNPTPDPTPLTIAVLTDAHIDPLYEAFGVGNCGEPTCCRKGQSPALNYMYKSNVDESIIEKSIIENDGEIALDLDMVPTIREMRTSSRTRFPVSRNDEPAGYWGDYRSCDSPIWAYDDVIDRIAETHKNIDVVYYIGDTIDHFVWETTYELIDEVNRHLIDKMRQSFGDDVLVVPVIGNHESQPTNQFAPVRITEPYLNTTWLYEALVRKWGHYLTDEAKETLLQGGDFSVLVRPGLRAISLNNNAAYKFNWWILYDPLEAKRHLDWLVEELYKAEQAGEKVHILTHIPPGVTDLTHTWTREYNKIVNRFSKTIAAEFNGHTHSDEFKIFYSPEGTPINVAWGAGSATTYSNYNLNYKIATFNPVTFEPHNIVNYVYNLTEANLTPNRRPHWFQLYDMRNTYSLNDLSAVSIDNLVKRMVTTHPHLLDLYSAFFGKLSDTRPLANCNTNCKLNQICRTVITVLWERERCIELINLHNPT